MRSYRRLTVLSVFLAAGVGLAISVGSSVVPSGDSRLAKSDSPSVGTAQRATGTVSVSGHRDPGAPVRPTEEGDSPLACDGAVNNGGRRSEHLSGPEIGSPDASEPASVRTLPAPLPRSDRSNLEAAGPSYVGAHPALAANQAGAPRSVLPDGIVDLLMNQQRRNEPAESIDTPPAQPSANSGLVRELPPGNSAAPVANGADTRVHRNTVCRTPGAQGDHFVINILDADIREVLDMLSREGALNILASPSVEGKVSATLNDVGIESALAAILRSTGFVAKREGQYIFVGTPDDFVQMARSTDEINTRVYHPNYVTSAELKSLITPLLTQGVGIISVTSEAKTGIPKELDDVGGDTFAGGDSLLVRDYEAVLCEIDQLVREIDLRPLQVHIEAMILSVKLSDECKFGVDFQILRQFEHTKFGWGSQIPVDKNNVPDLNELVFDGGLKFGFLDDSLGAFLNALEKVGDTNVIATPRLMVVNKHAAVIQIGKEEGYVNTTQTETAATQTVEMLELGTILRIRPFVSNDGMIRLEVRPEISDGNVTVEGGFTLPHKEITQVTTNIMVRDGCTAVIGGLIQDKQQADRSQIPLLGSLPVVGFAFREKDENLDRHELIVLITPNVVREREMYREAATQACEFQRRQSVYGEKMSPIGKRSLARKYVRRAQAAWLAGNRREALRMAELAVHFDPINREAIELRSDIWLGKTIQTPGAIQPDVLHPTGPLDGPQLPPWVLKQLGEPKTPPLGADELRPAATGGNGAMGGLPGRGYQSDGRKQAVSRVPGRREGGPAAGAPAAGFAEAHGVVGPASAGARTDALPLNHDSTDTLTVLPAPPGQPGPAPVNQPANPSLQ